MDKLGDRLVRSAEPDPADLRALVALQGEFAVALGEVAARVKGALPAELQVTTRLKTVNTLIDKVRRRTRLSTIQDIAGVRVIGDFGLTRQDQIVAQLGSQFRHCKVVDRRQAPTVGYRAVHLIVQMDGFPAEIQVRTELQHAWASTTERLADTWGRGIRYGAPPTGRDEGEVERRTVMLRHWLAVSDRLAHHESVDLAASQILRGDEALSGPIVEAARLLFEELRAAGPEVSAVMLASMNAILAIRGSKGGA